MTARRWTSNGLKSGPKSRATSARRCVVEQREDLVVLAPQLAQPLHGQRLGRDDEAAFDLSRCARSRFRIRQASMVLPRPTSSASSQRTGSLALARSATWSWCGKSRMRPPRKEPRPSASRRLEEVQDVEAGRRSPRPRSRSPRARRSRSAPSSSRGHSSWEDAVRPFASRNVPSGRRAAMVVFSWVAVMRTGRPGLRSTGTSASVLGGQPQRRPRARELDDERSTVDAR